MSAHLTPEGIEAAARGEAAPHLEGCAQCRGRVADARGRQRLLSGLPRMTLSEVGFRRVEARLDEAIAAGDVEPGWRGVLGWRLGLVAAVLVAALGFGLLQGDTRPERLTRVLPQAPRVTAPFHPLTVLAASTDAQARAPGSAWRALGAGDVLAAGEAVSAARLSLAPATPDGWHFEVAGSLSLGVEATLTLGAGEVRAKVGAPAPTAEVLAGTWRVLASEALFSVTRAAAEVILEVSRGEVEVVDTLTGERRKVSAPARLRWSDGAPLSAGVSEAPAGVTLGALPAKPWTLLDATALPAGSAVSLDGQALDAAPFRRLVSAGRHRLLVVPPGQPEWARWIDLVGGQPFAAPPEAAPAEAPEPTADAVAELAAALQRQRPKLAACYEKWLKANPGARGEVVLEVTVTAQGRVRRAAVGAGTISPASAECLVTTAKTLVLPALGAEATIEVPLVLRTPGGR